MALWLAFAAALVSWPTLHGSHEVCIGACKPAHALHTLSCAEASRSLGLPAAGNVLLQSCPEDVRGYRAKLSDYGLSGLLDSSQTRIHSRCMGTGGAALGRATAMQGACPCYPGLVQGAFGGEKGLRTCCGRQGGGRYCW
jgi:hypothetical protein